MIILIVCTLLVSLVIFYVASGFKQRAERLKNSKEVIATVVIPSLFIARPIKLYIPTPAFVANMRAGIEKRLIEVRQLWKREKDLFRKLWNEMTKELREDFLEKLLDELDLNLEPYSEREDLGRLLFSHFSVKNHTAKIGEDTRFGLSLLLERVGSDSSNANANTSNNKSGNSEPTHSTVSTDRDSLMKLSEMKVVRAVPAPEGCSNRDYTSKATTIKDENNSHSKSSSDSNSKGSGESSGDGDGMRGEVQEFLDTLRCLSFAVFSRHVLDRYYSHKMGKKGIWLFLDRFGLSIGMGLLAVLAVWVMDYLGILKEFFWGFS